MAETKIREFRKRYPQYDDLSDRELAEGLHRKHYSDMEFETFAERVGLLFGTIPERMAMNVLGDEDTGKTFERFIWSLRETFAFDPTPQIINPLFEVWANRDKFRDAPIEGMADQGKLPEARYSEYTSPTMRALGRLTGPTIGASPKQLEHLWRGYTGSLGMYALDVADVGSRAMMDMPPQPEMRIDDWPVVRSFLRAEPARSTRYLTELYDLHARANQLYRTVRAYQREGRADAARRLLEQEEEVLQARGALQDAAQFNSRVRKRMDAIHRAEDMTPAEKRREIDELLALRNENTKETVQAVREFFREQEGTRRRGGERRGPCLHSSRGQQSRSRDEGVAP